MERRCHSKAGNAKRIDGDFGIEAKADPEIQRAHGTFPARKARKVSVGKFPEGQRSELEDRWGMPWTPASGHVCPSAFPKGTLREEAAGPAAPFRGFVSGSGGIGTFTQTPGPPRSPCRMAILATPSSDGPARREGLWTALGKGQ